MGGNEAIETGIRGRQAQCAFITTAKRIVGHPENRGRRASRLARWVAWQGWQRVVRRPRTIELHDGVRMVCYPHDHITSLALYCGLYDAEEMRFLLAWMRPGDTMLDVGSNVAPYSLLATSMPGTVAIAFEPGSLAQRRARVNFELNAVADRVTLVPAAVSDVDGLGTLTADRWATNALVGADHSGPSERVATVRLDTYESDHPFDQVSLIKIDVEGHELAVLRGAQGVLARHRPALIVEVNEPAKLRAWAEEAGYHSVRYHLDSRELGPAPWPEQRGGNVILVPELDVALSRVAAGVDGAR